jgi:phage-related minor tail protein
VCSSDLGLMGESGPEVIAPLARTPSGDMGIRVVGGGEDGGGRGGNNVQLNTGDINVSIQGGSNGNSGDDARLAKRVGAEVKGNLQQLVQEEIAKAMAPGGQMRKRY